MLRYRRIAVPAFVAGLMLVTTVAARDAARERFTNRAPGSGAPAATAPSRPRAERFSLDTTAAFGPRVYTRGSGTTSEFQDAFSLTFDPSRRYLLVVENGAADGTHRVTSCVLELNRTDVLNENDLGSTVASVSRVVDPIGSNTLKLTLTGPAASYVTVKLLAVPRPDADLFGPETFARSTGQPQTLSRTFARPASTCAPYELVLVNGDLAGGNRVTSAQVWLNGALVLRPNDFSPNVATIRRQVGLLANNTLEVRIAGSPGSRFTLSVTGADCAPPVLAITAPPQNLLTRLTSVTVAGTVADLTATEVRVAGALATTVGTNGFTADVALALEGANVIHVVASDAAGNSVDSTRVVIRDTEAPSLAVATPAEGSSTSASTIVVSGTASDAHDFVVTVNGDTTPVVAGAFDRSVPLALGANLVTVVATDVVGNANTVVRHVTRTSSSGGLPPDPSTVAPAVDPILATDFFDATTFLYSGPSPIQTGVVPGTIDTRRVAVIRGQVFTRDGAPLSGATVRIAGHPEFGQTLSRADGGYDLAVNGGGLLTVELAKSGFLTAQREVSVAWHDYVWVKDVALVGADPAVTAVDFTAPIQVARGSSVSDTAGVRRATLLFEQGTTAAAELPGGGTQALGTLHVRATEYTVGARGPMSMPAELPAMSGYTYCAELSVDEAEAAGATGVAFSRPVHFYVENFLGLPVGLPVPVGRYDRGRSDWVAESNGRVIRVLDPSGGLANVDANGDSLADSADSLAALGFTANERTELAALYVPGQTLWRADVSHFSPLDANYPTSERPVPEKEAKGGNEKKDCPDQRNGSIVDCENLMLGEQVGVAGTPFTLVYNSDRVLGYQASRSTDIPITGATVTPELDHVELTIEIAGQRHTRRFPPAPNQVYTFTWNGLDGYGRRVQGEQLADIRVDYLYATLYNIPAGTAQSFGLPCTGPGTIPGYLECRIPSYQGRSDSLTLRGLTSIVPMGGIAFQPQGVGAWTLDAHHTYDPQGRTLHLGSGGTQSGAQLTPAIVSVGGSHVFGYGGDGGPALQARLYTPTGIAGGADGSLYFADSDNHRIRRIGPDSIITTVAGIGAAGFAGDGGPATNAQLQGPRGIAVGPDGSLYIADTDNNRVRRVAPDGTIHTLAGTGVAGFAGDGGPAVAARLNHPRGLALSADGDLYVADMGNNRIRVIRTDGSIVTLAGTGIAGFAGDGGAAFQSRLNVPEGVGVGPDGTVYIADTGNNRIRRVSRDGTITTFAGTGSPDSGGDGGPATGAGLSHPTGVAVDAERSVYIADRGNSLIRVVDSEGTIRRLGGRGPSFSGLVRSRVNPGPETPLATYPATDAPLQDPTGVVVAADGRLYFTDAQRQELFVVTPVLPGYSLTSIVLPSRDASELYVFNSRGRHLRTLDALTGATRVRFDYDGAGRLLAAADADGNTTTIERDGSGTATAIVGPYGQRTRLGYDANGYLSRIVNAAGDTTRAGYDAGGLLTSFALPRGFASAIAYDALGRLQQDADAAGGGQSLTRVPTASGQQSTHTTAEGRVTQYVSEDLGQGAERRTVIDPAGLQTVTTRTADGVTKVVSPDGTQRESHALEDPRFGMQAPRTDPTKIRTPSGRTLTSVEIRSFSGLDPVDPLSFFSYDRINRVNGFDYTLTYDKYANLLTQRTPMGRVTETDIDSVGRPLEVRVAGLSPVHYTYDGRGRLASSTQGGRVWSYGYDGSGRLASVTDPLSRTTRFEYDLADRLTRQVLPDLREVRYGYDRNGNLASLTPPGRPAHRFAYTPLDLTSRYSPPDVGLDSTGTGYGYDRDRALRTIERPDSVTVTMGYDGGGRLATVSEPRGMHTFGYQAGSGNLASVTSPDGVTLGYSYDGFLPTGESWSGAVNGSVTLTYDNFFRPQSQSVNGADDVPFSYDADGLLTQAGEETLDRSPENGLLAGTTLGSVTTAQSYNGAGELSAFAARYGSTELLTTSYGRDSLGRITSLTETIVDSAGVPTTTAWGYEYDLAGRLERVRKDGVLSQEYTYDANGNRLTYRGASAADTSSATYDAQDRMLRYGNVRYAYGANGELRAKVSGADTTRYAYDVLGNLVRVALPGGDVVGYVIDGQNRRVARKVNGRVTTAWLYQNGLNPIAELDSAGTVVSRYVYGSRGHVPDYVVRNGSTYRIVTDHLGSVRLVVDVTSGQVVERADYDAWGVVTRMEGAEPLTLGYAGGITDVATGLVRFGARDYEAGVGRWTRSDIADVAPVVVNGYVYADGEPVGHIDPEGDLTQTEALSIRGNWTLLGTFVGSVAGFLLGGGGPALTGGGTVVAPATAMAGARIGAALGAAGGLAVGNAIVNGLGGVTAFCSADGSGGGGGGEDQPEDRMGGNQRENEQARAAAREAGLSREEREIFHRAISGERHGYRELVEIAKAVKRGEIH